MPYTINWLVQNRIVLEAIEGTISEAEARDIGKRNYDMIREGSTPVHFIVDLSETVSVPANVRLAIETSQYLRDPGMGWLLVISQRPQIRLVISVAHNSLRFNLRNCSTREEALDFLYQIDSTLSPGRMLLDDNL